VRLYPDGRSIVIGDGIVADAVREGWTARFS